VTLSYQSRSARAGRSLASSPKDSARGASTKGGGKRAAASSAAGKQRASSPKDSAREGKATANARARAAASSAASQRAASPKDSARASRGSSRAGSKLPQALIYGPGEPWLSEGKCLDSKGRACSLWTAVVRMKGQSPRAFREVLTEYFGLKARDSLLLESILWAAEKTGRAEPLKQGGKVVAWRVAIDPEARWTLDVRTSGASKG
jgi:hypothetical protein